MKRIPTSLTRSARVAHDKRQLAREFRKSPTPAEKTAWNLLRNRRCLGMKFRRQQVVRGFVVDFYCASLDLVIEIDGAIHDRMEQRDKGRSELLEQFGVRILRISNEHVTALHLRELLLPHVPPSPLRRGGPGG